MHQNLGIATFDTLYLILKINPDGSFALETSAAITGRIGPLTAVVERMGAMRDDRVLRRRRQQPRPGRPVARLQAAERRRPLDRRRRRQGRRLPLSSTPTSGEYAGALELDVLAASSRSRRSASSRTRMPDGSTGFSLLIIITAEFGTGIQLGFGFTLLGVGGLLGLNRTMKLEALAEGVRTGAVESVMFPQDVVANAPRIISRPARVLPAAAGHVPDRPDGEARLGHADADQPSSLGVIIEIPGNIAILGVLKCALPDEDAALLVLQVNFIGAHRVRQEAAVVLRRRCTTVARAVHDHRRRDGPARRVGRRRRTSCSASAASTRSSRRRRCRSRRPQRIAVSILNEPFARIRVEGYFAVTSNTVQFGAARRAVLRRQRVLASRATSASTRCSSSRRSTSSSRSRRRCR